MMRKASMVKVRCNVKAEIRNESGELLETRRAKNLVVNTGLVAIKDLFAGVGSRANKMQVGTGTTAADATDTSLVSTLLTKDITRRIEGTYSVTYQALVGLSEGNGNDLSEVGTFCDSVMFARAVLDPVISKTSSIQVTLSHVFTFEAA